MWPIDSLPNDITTARVILYGYESSLADNASFQNLSDLGASLRMDLQSFYVRQVGAIASIVHNTLPLLTTAFNLPDQFYIFKETHNFHRP